MYPAPYESKDSGSIPALLAARCGLGFGSDDDIVLVVVVVVAVVAVIVVISGFLGRL